MEGEATVYSLPTFSLPHLELALHVADLRELMEFAGERGITTRDTRLERYARFLTRVADEGLDAVEPSKLFPAASDAPCETKMDWLLYVLREVHELMWILKGLKASLPIGVDRKLADVVGGRDFAALDVNSHSRNTQFELRIASYFCQAGYHVDVSTDTDILAVNDDEAFFLECKRIASASQLAKRLAHARSQLGIRMPRKDGRRRVLGCVAADVTKVAFAHNGLTWAFTNEHSRDVIEQRLVAAVESARPALTDNGCRKLLCHWLQIHIASLIMRPIVTPASRFSSHVEVRPRLSAKETRSVRSFMDAIEAASKPDSRSRAPEPFILRTSINIPAESDFLLKAELVESLWQRGGTPTQKDQELVIGALTIDGATHEFSYREMTMLSRDMVEQWRRERATDEVSADLALLARLLLRRYPYVGHGPEGIDG